MKKHIILLAIILCAAISHAQVFPVKINATTGTIDTTGWNLKGKDGKDGINGINGTNGIDGKAATVTVGTVTTLPAGSPATVTNTGTPTNAVLSFGLPQGQSTTGTGSFAIPSFWSIAFCANFTEFEAACIKANAGSITQIFVVQSFTLTRKIRFSDTPNNPSIQLNIEGCGNQITIADGIDTAFVRIFPSLTKAKVKVGFEFNVSNLRHKGNGNDICYYLSSTYNSGFDNCWFTGSKVGVELRWSLQASVTNNRFNDNTYCGLVLDYDRFTGGSNSDSQPNHPYVVNNRFRAMPGAFAGVRCIGTSGTYIVHNIFEGGDTAHVSSNHAIYISDEASNVVKDGYIGWNHFEAIFPTAALWMRGKDVIYYTGYNYSQYDCILIHFESSAYGHIYVEAIPWLTGGTKFESVGGGARWHWSKIKFNPLTASLWNGSVPVSQEINAVNPSGQVPYINLNGKNVVTQ